jgi:hypothetical protein
VSGNNSAIEEIPAKGSRLAIAARYALVIFGAAAGSAIPKLLVHRAFATPANYRLGGPIVLASTAGLFWFALSFVALARASSGNATSPQGQNRPPARTRTVLRTIPQALAIAGVLSISAWTGLVLNDEIFESRSLPWIAPLITVQDFGFAEASRMFPCQIEGADTGCEAYKWLPTFLAANSLFYFSLVLITMLSCQHWGGIRTTMQSGSRLFARWCIVVVTTGLVALQIMHGLNLDTQDSLYPNPGIGHWHFGAWEQINDITGTLITISGLSLPFYLYRVIRRAPGVVEVRSRLAEATSVAATMLVALTLGNVY